ncbi:MAG TPA: FAD-binding oxidoreductase, partial [Candidatus Saccharimonas sp.]|nr:FAD-binding oxidoreductase [Candidatus Saccharimonas sp.]
MHHLLRMERDTVVVQPGLGFQLLQQSLQTMGRWLPPAPLSAAYSTIGGAVANDAGSEKSVKYGTIRRYVKGLRVVLSDGSLVETRRLSPRELSRKKGQSNLEGELYRGLDNLLTDHAELIASHTPATTKNTAGYGRSHVRGRDGSFDLSQIFIGSQGTLGIITELTLCTIAWQPRTTLVAAYCHDLHAVGDIMERLRALAPSALEFVDGHLLEQVRRERPQDITGLLPDGRLPRLVLLAEFDNRSFVMQTLRSRRAHALLGRHEAPGHITADPVQQRALWKLRESATAVSLLAAGAKRAVPFVDDLIVPPAAFAQCLERLSRLLGKHGIECGLWGHAGDGHIHLQPLLDLSKTKDQSRLFALAEDLTDLAASLGGSISGQYGDGLARGPYLERLYGSEYAAVLAQVKQLFDPHGILNPGKKTAATHDGARAALRADYLPPFPQFLPYT